LLSTGVGGLNFSSKSEIIACLPALVPANLLAVFHNIGFQAGVKAGDARVPEKFAQQNPGKGLGRLRKRMHSSRSHSERVFL
jgi:hypothetical protein